MLEEFNRMRVVQESEALKSALLDSITHDLRTPLTSIKAAATTLLSRPAYAVDRDFLLVINEECDRLNELLQNVLDMARIEGRHLRPALRRQSLPPIIEEAIAYSQVPRSRLKIDVPDDLPEVKVDGVLLSRALVQLLTNAAAYSPPDTPIELRAFTRDGEVITEVRDQGYGIAPELLPRVFDKFVRGEQAQHERPEGMGVGLSIARGIIDLHGGRMSASSQPGRGSVFCISLLPATEGSNANANSGGR
jgi:two-component system sensor histidine kinase KdpD